MVALLNKHQAMFVNLTVIWLIIVPFYELLNSIFFLQFTHYWDVWQQVNFGSSMQNCTKPNAHQCYLR